jgi:hypothetical protein
VRRALIVVAVVATATVGCLDPRLYRGDGRLEAKPWNRWLGAIEYRLVFDPIDVSHTGARHYAAAVMPDVEFVPRLVVSAKDHRELDADKPPLRGSLADASAGRAGARGMSSGGPTRRMALVLRCLDAGSIGGNPAVRIAARVVAVHPDARR